MTNRYTEQLAERMRAKKLSARGLNAVAFLTVKDDVKAALDAGYVLKDIWADMRECERIHFSYDTFLRLVKRFIDLVPDRTPSSSSRQKNTAPAKKAASGLPVKYSNQPSSPISTPKEFVYNPVPNKDELL